jgi:hypothetical protein
VYDKKWMVAEESNCRDKLKFKIMNNPFYKRLKKKEGLQPVGNTISNVHCYDILANPLYQEDLQYTPLIEREGGDDERLFLND